MRSLAWVVQANMRDQALRHQIETALDALGEERHAVSLVAAYVRDREER